MSKSGYTRPGCIELLRRKRELLDAAGENRYPRRSDFSDEEVNAVKAFLGPWPRALEAAGIKPPRDDDRKQANLEKRIRAKRRRTDAKKQSKASSGDSEST